MRSPETLARGPRTLGKRQADRSDVRQEFARFAKPDPASSRSQPDGRRALHACEYLTTPAFKNLSLPFCSCETSAAALVGARFRAPFIQRLEHYVISIMCK